MQFPSSAFQSPTAHSGFLSFAPCAYFASFGARARHLYICVLCMQSRALKRAVGGKKSSSGEQSPLRVHDGRAFASHSECVCWSARLRRLSSASALFCSNHFCFTGCSTSSAPCGPLSTRCCRLLSWFRRCTNDPYKYMYHIYCHFCSIHRLERRQVVTESCMLHANDFRLRLANLNPQSSSPFLALTLSLVSSLRSPSPLALSLPLGRDGGTEGQRDGGR